MKLDCAPVSISILAVSPLSLPLSLPWNSISFRLLELVVYDVCVLMVLSSRADVLVAALALS
jgi:hypothetical protein